MRENNKSEVDKRIYEFKEKYELSPMDEFDLRTVFELEEEYNSLSSSNPDHTRRRSEVLKMRYDLKGRLSKPVKKESYIDLFSESDVRNRSIEIQDGSLILKANMSKILNERLAYGELEGKLINVKNFRCVGKTTALINFAKEKGYIAIVRFNDKELRKIHGYDDIYNDMDNRLDFMRGKKCVIDEGVDAYSLGLNVVTGYINK